MSKNETVFHSTAIVHPQAQIEQGVSIGPYAVIGKKVSVGKNTRIDSHVHIDGNTEIGQNCHLFPFCAIGTDPQDLTYKGEDTSVTIGDRNIFREFVTVHKGTVKGRDKTEIGDGNYFMAYSHVAHDCRVGNETVLTNGVALGGHVTVDDCVNMSAYSAVHQFCRVGKHALIGGISTITQDVLPFCRVAGGRPTLFYGLNAIGLRRKGFSRERIRAIKGMFRFIFYSDLNTNQALERIRDEFPPGDDRDEIIRFIEASERGIVKRTAEKWGKDSE
ncbi:MAG: acyl-ACP--UDP-N-acetylglucosamine O-acyltransferase [Candidatus Aminicenantes bacterium]|jgi:UDP-N-acetylglucosamine acyltransferase